MTIISSGAEATIELENGIIIKNRVRKNYRIAEIDDKLRKARTRREAKVLEKLSGFPCPRLIKQNEYSIYMTYISGKKFRDIVNSENANKLGAELGQKIYFIHSLGIIHGDLTTSNIIFNEELYIIDFGLSFFSNKIEDRAVDLHLLKQALISKHHEIWEECFSAVISSYPSKEVLHRLDIVEGRGRNKLKSH